MKRRHALAIGLVTLLLFASPWPQGERPAPDGTWKQPQRRQGVQHVFPLFDSGAMISFDVPPGWKAIGITPEVQEGIIAAYVHGQESLIFFGRRADGWSVDEAACAHVKLIEDEPQSMLLDGLSPVAIAGYPARQFCYCGEGLQFDVKTKRSTPSLLCHMVRTVVVNGRILRIQASVVVPQSGKPQIPAGTAQKQQLRQRARQLQNVLEKVGICAGGASA